MASPRPTRSSAARRAPGPPAPAVPPICIVVSRYNATVTDALLAGAVGAYRRAGGRLDGLYIAEAAGAFEIVAIAAAAARSGTFAGVVAIGCIIKGETRHDEFLAHAVTSGLAGISAQTGVPVGLAVLTVNTTAQARARAGLPGSPSSARSAPHSSGNKGAEAMQATLHSAAEIAMLADSGHTRRAMARGQAAQRLMRGSSGASPDKLAARVAPAPRSTRSRTKASGGGR